jgi:hypothetical protein
VISSFGQGTIRGKIIDTNGETLIGVTVMLKNNRAVGTSSDFDGNYTLTFKDAGQQVVVFTYVSYKNQEITVNPEGKVVVKDIIMESSAQELKGVEISAKATKAREYFSEMVKKNAAVSMDYISSETMKKTGDANVVAAVARVSGVSTNGGFITVRGIGDRYVKTSVNGSMIPTLDPFTNNIKLDFNKKVRTFSKKTSYSNEAFFLSNSQVSIFKIQKYLEAQALHTKENFLKMDTNEIKKHSKSKFEKKFFFLMKMYSLGILMDSIHGVSPIFENSENTLFQSLFKSTFTKKSTKAVD